jgi:hypothetical protein
MNPDNFQQAWQASQPRPAIDAEALLVEVRRHERLFAATIFWRDFREVGVALVTMVVWIFLGVRSAAPWTWYLAIPALAWIAGFMLVDRWRQRRTPPAGQPLNACVAHSLAEVEHQIWLLRNVWWWYLLPLALFLLAFLGESSWRERSGGWLTAVALSLALLVIAIVLGGVYWLNQMAVRDNLQPRQRELATLLQSLQEEAEE